MSCRCFLLKNTYRFWLVHVNNTYSAVSYMFTTDTATETDRFSDPPQLSRQSFLSLIKNYIFSGKNTVIKFEVGLE